ncbi:MAG TPA: FecR family protein [Verrucomicrobiae bacterium]|nr:FecR family protein [Verrucomicrobiae bacterium]
MKSRYLAMILGLMSSAAMADSQIGNVVQPDYSGATGTRAVSSAALEELHFNRDVFGGETVKTPADGSTVIKFQDQTQIQVGHGSTIVLDSFVYDPQTATSTGSIAFTKGVFRFISGTANDKAVGLRTPTTTMAIRGTRVLINVGDDGSSDVGVIDGSVEVSPCGGGSPVTLTQGQAVRVSAACNGAEHMPLAEVPVDATVASDFDAPSPALNGSALASHQSNLAKGALGGNAAHEVSPGDPDRDGDKDAPGED